MYDVIIVGLGPAGIACARECKLRNPNAKILVIEQGKPIDKRGCPAQEKGIKCINCSICSVMSGTGGAGANSDGKFTMPQEAGPYHIGGNLPLYIGLEETNKLVLEQHKNNCAKGAPNNIAESVDNVFISNFDKHLNAVGLFRAKADVNHIGTSEVRKLYKEYENELKNMGVDILFNTVVSDLIVVGRKCVGVVTADEKRLKAKHIAFATGRSGAKWLEEMSNKYGIDIEPENVDFGFRVEVSSDIMEQVDKNLYEAKIIGDYNGVQVRMFCTNPKGAVVIENADDIKFVNGHSDNVVLSNNTNFAILASYKVDIEHPSDMVRKIAKAINDLGNGQPVIQRWGDILKGRVTTEQDLEKNSIIPSLNSAVSGDMTNIFPEKALTSIKKYMSNLGKVIPGIDDDDVLAYGLEAKFCHSGIKLDKQLKCSIGVYILGDAGCTHGLASAAASGIYVARCIFPD